jgi:hypothetical protein
VQVLVQIRWRRIQTTIRQQTILIDEPDEQRNILNVSKVTVAPNLVVLAAGNVTGIFIVFIERCVHGIILKHWSRGRVRKWRQIEY